VHSLKSAKHVADIRNYGLAAGFTIASAARRAGQAALRDRDEMPGKRLLRALWWRHHPAGTALHHRPKAEIDSLINALGEAMNATA
jgi:beta-alanine--pyruvate transaminase